jgi:membrane protein implicated in regulation of membrane protease activity
MKKYGTIIVFGGGGVLVGAGFMELMMGIGWGALLLVAGIGVLAFGYAKLMRGSGNDPDQGTFNGLGGQGKQQSEVVKDNGAAVWEQIEK